MKIIDLKIYEFSLPLIKPLRLKHASITKRDGIIIQLINEAGQSGFGEIAPLPVFSRESFDDTLKQVINLKIQLKEQSLPEGLIPVTNRFAQWLSSFFLYPSVQFGVEMAVLNLFANAQNTSLCQLINPQAKASIPLNGLFLNGAGEAVLKQTEEMWQRGFRTFKLKVGRNDLDEDIKITQVLQKRLGQEGTLRLDANQAWDYDHALDFAKKIDTAHVEYIEDPFSTIDRLADFAAAARLKVALDECFTSQMIRKTSLDSSIGAIILKPTILGGIEKTIYWIQELQKQNIKPVISSAFESGLGLLTLAQLAACVDPIPAAGLDTAKWFAEDLLKEKIPITNGHMDISPSGIKEEHLNMKNLKEITA